MQNRQVNNNTAKDAHTSLKVPPITAMKSSSSSTPAKAAVASSNGGGGGGATVHGDGSLTARCGGRNTQLYHYYQHLVREPLEDANARLATVNNFFTDLNNITTTTMATTTTPFSCGIIAPAHGDDDAAFGAMTTSASDAAALKGCAVIGSHSPPHHHSNNNNDKKAIAATTPPPPPPHLSAYYSTWVAIALACCTDGWSMVRKKAAGETAIALARHLKEHYRGTLHHTVNNSTNGFEKQTHRQTPSSLSSSHPTATMNGDFRRSNSSAAALLVSSAKCTSVINGQRLLRGTDTNDDGSGEAKKAATTPAPRRSFSSRGGQGLNRHADPTTFTITSASSSSSSTLPNSPASPVGSGALSGGRRLAPPPSRLKKTMGDDHSPSASPRGASSGKRSASSSSSTASPLMSASAARRSGSQQSQQPRITIPTTPRAPSASSSAAAKQHKAPHQLHTTATLSHRTASTSALPSASPSSAVAPSSLLPSLFPIHDLLGRCLAFKSKWYVQEGLLLLVDKCLQQDVIKRFFRDHFEATAWHLLQRVALGLVAHPQLPVRSLACKVSAALVAVQSFETSSSSSTTCLSSKARSEELQQLLLCVAVKQIRNGLEKAKAIEDRTTNTNNSNDGKGTMLTSMMMASSSCNSEAQQASAAMIEGGISLLLALDPQWSSKHLARYTVLISELAYNKAASIRFEIADLLSRLPLKDLEATWQPRLLATKMSPRSPITRQLEPSWQSKETFLIALVTSLKRMAVGSRAAELMREAARIAEDQEQAEKRAVSADGPTSTTATACYSSSPSVLSLEDASSAKAVLLSLKCALDASPEFEVQRVGLQAIPLLAQIWVMKGSLFQRLSTPTITVAPPPKGGGCTLLRSPVSSSCRNFAADAEDAASDLAYLRSSREIARWLCWFAVLRRALAVHGRRVHSYYREGSGGGGGGTSTSQDFAAFHHHHHGGGGGGGGGGCATHTNSNASSPQHRISRRETSHSQQQQQHTDNSLLAAGSTAWPESPPLHGNALRIEGCSAAAAALSENTSGATPPPPSSGAANEALVSFKIVTDEQQHQTPRRKQQNAAHLLLAVTPPSGLMKHSPSRLQSLAKMTAGMHYFTHKVTESELEDSKQWVAAIIASGGGGDSSDVTPSQESSPLTGQHQQPRPSDQPLPPSAFTGASASLSLSSCVPLSSWERVVLTSYDLDMDLVGAGLGAGVAMRGGEQHNHDDASQTTVASPPSPTARPPTTSATASVGVTSPLSPFFLTSPTSDNSNDGSLSSLSSRQNNVVSPPPLRLSPASAADWLVALREDENISKHAVAYASRYITLDPPLLESVVLNAWLPTIAAAKTHTHVVCLLLDAIRIAVSRNAAIASRCPHPFLFLTHTSYQPPAIEEGGTSGYDGTDWIESLVGKAHLAAGGGGGVAHSYANAYSSAGGGYEGGGGLTMMGSSVFFATSSNDVAGTMHSAASSTPERRRSSTLALAAGGGFVAGGGGGGGGGGAAGFFSLPSLGLSSESHKAVFKVISTAIFLNKGAEPAALHHAELLLATMQRSLAAEGDLYAVPILGLRRLKFIFPSHKEFLAVQLGKCKSTTAAAAAAVMSKKEENKEESDWDASSDDDNDNAKKTNNDFDDSSSGDDDDWDASSSDEEDDAKQSLLVAGISVGDEVERVKRLLRFVDFIAAADGSPTARQRGASESSTIESKSHHGPPVLMSELEFLRQHDREMALASGK